MGTGFKDQEHDHNFDDKEVLSRKAVFKVRIENKDRVLMCKFCKLSIENKDGVLICKFYAVGL